MADDPKSQKPDLGSQLGQSRPSPEAMKKWSQFLAQVWADDALKKRLIANPSAVFQEHGIPTPPGVELRVVENTSNVTYFVLPPKPAGDVTELSASELAGVAGGWTCCWASVVSPVPRSPIPAPATTTGPGPILVSYKL